MRRDGLGFVFMSGSRITDDETRDSMNDIESKLSQANGDVKTVLSSTNE